VLKRALATTAVWLAFVLAIDLPPVMASSGVAFAFLFAWWDEQGRMAAEPDERLYPEEPEDEDDDVFEEQLTLLDV
jgi:hypothetical protein